MASQAFRRSSRLLTAGSYQAVFDCAEKKVSDSSFLILARSNHLSSARLGLVVAKKNIKLAVQRNRIKRMVRETFRSQDELPCLDSIVLVRRGADKLNNPELQRRLNKLWHRLQKS